MIEAVMHFFGMCPDAHSHISISDFLMTSWDSVMIYVSRLKIFFMKLKTYTIQFFK